MGYEANDIQFSDDALGLGRALRLTMNAGFRATFSQDSDNADITVVTYDPGYTDPVDRVVKTSSFTVGALGEIQAPLFIIDATAGNIVITMPRTLLNNNRYTFIRIDNTSNTVTFQGYDGIETFNWPGWLKYGDSVTLLTDHTNWFNISQNSSRGTWTPVVTLNGAGTVPQYSTALGTWTIVDRLCFFNIQLSGDGGNEGAGASGILISLPFTTGSGQLPIISQLGVAVNGTDESDLYCSMSASSSTMAILKRASSTALAEFTGADQNNTTRGIYITGKILLN